MNEAIRTMVPTIVLALGLAPACAVVAEEEGVGYETHEKTKTVPTTTAPTTTASTTTASDPPTVCPCAWPGPSTACVGSGKCAYDNACGGKSIFTCTNGVFVGGVEGCGVYLPPRSLDCPSGVPAIASACAVPDTVQCSYANHCGATATYVCSLEAWSLEANPCGDPPPACPSTIPKDGSRCPTEVTCGYYDGTMWLAKCDGRTWSVTTNNQCP